jgi:hypothetical protein
MTNSAAAPRPKARGFALVRDKNGKPRIDGDPRFLPQPIINMMTDAEFSAAIEEYEDGLS